MNVKPPSFGGSVVGRLLLMGLGVVFLSNTLFGLFLDWVEDVARLRRVAADVCVWARVPDRRWLLHGVRRDRAVWSGLKDGVGNAFTASSNWVFVLPMCYPYQRH